MDKHVLLLFQVIWGMFKKNEYCIIRGLNGQINLANHWNLSLYFFLNYKLYKIASNYLYFDWTVKEIFFIFVIINFQIKRNLRIYLGNCSDNYDQYMLGIVDTNQHCFILFSDRRLISIKRTKRLVFFTNSFFKVSLKRIRA